MICDSGCANIGAMLSVGLSVVLVAFSVLLAGASLKRHMPVPLSAALIGGGLMALALLFAGLSRAGLGFEQAATVTLTLRFAAALVLIAATWAFIESPGDEA